MVCAPNSAEARSRRAWRPAAHGCSAARQAGRLFDQLSALKSEGNLKAVAEEAEADEKRQQHEVGKAEEGKKEHEAEEEAA